jgi:predicted alpha/beta-hydrolase family hydrolase
VSYARANLLPVLEQVLPRRFGGASIHYQLVEEEAADTSTRIVLRVHPSVGPVDETALRQRFLEELARDGSLLDRYQVELLRHARAVTISRQPPIATKAGKILPFQIIRGDRRPAG